MLKIFIRVLGRHANDFINYCNINILHGIFFFGVFVLNLSLILLTAGANGASHSCNIVEEWNSSFGLPISTDEFHSVEQTSDLGYIATGYTDSYYTYVHPSGEVYGDLWLLKADPSGKELWNRSFGGGNHDYFDGGECVRQNPDGSYIIAGYTQSWGAGDYDVWLIKTNTNGIELWNKTYGKAFVDVGAGVELDRNGGYIIGGSTRSFGSGGFDIWLIKADSNGLESWNRTFGGSQDDWCFSIKQAKDRGYIIAGSTDSLEPKGAWVIKTDASGYEVWNRTFGDLGFLRARSILQTKDGGYVVAGDGSGKAYLIKIDSQGNRKWIKTFGRSGDDGFLSARQTFDGGFISVGYKNMMDIWLVKTDRFGNELWNATYGGVGQNLGWDIQQTRDSGYIVAGGVNGGPFNGSLIKFKPRCKSDDNGLAEMSTESVKLGKQTATSYGPMSGANNTIVISSNQDDSKNFKSKK